ncbi:seipin-2 [Lycium barbarum]|uniref:seipin-2 n=1 Tax=Lycium barbarum TaxID=112863 RepID=UPI00293E86CD|nr:seipin-2 [Lycium barbarum]
MEDTKPNKQANDGDLFDDVAEEFPDIFSDAVTGGTENDVSTNQSPEIECVPSASLRRRRPSSYIKSGNESANFRPSVSFQSYSHSREKKLWFSRKLMEMDKDKTGNLNDTENSNSMQLDLSTESQNGSVDGENKDIQTVMNANSVITENSRSMQLDLSTESQQSSVDEENKEISSVVNANSDSVITDVNNEGIDNSEVVDSDLRGNNDSSLNLLFDLANVVIKAVGFQVNMLITIVSLMIKLFTFPVWLIYSSYMFVMDPFQIMRRGKRYAIGKFMRGFGFVLNFVSVWLKEKSSVWRLGLQFGWGCLWSVYVCVVLVGLLVSAFIMGGILMRIIVEEPIRMNEPLNFDYTAKSPVAYVPIIRSPAVTCGGDSKDQVVVGMVDGMRVIPLNHKLQVTVSLTLPESDYNRNLGIFQVRVDFLTANGKVLASSRRPCMLQFKSNPIRLLSTFLRAAPLVTGYTSESQKLKVDFKGFSEGIVPTACLRVIIEQRAEFHPGGGIPEIYAASSTLESELPFLKRMLWYWKTTLFVWVSMTLFTMEFLFALLCCKPLIIPRLRLRHDSNSRTGSQNNPPIER